MVSSYGGIKLSIPIGTMTATLAGPNEPTSRFRAATILTEGASLARPQLLPDDALCKMVDWHESLSPFDSLGNHLCRLCNHTTPFTKYIILSIYDKKFLFTDAMVC